MALRCSLLPVHVHVQVQYVLQGVWNEVISLSLSCTSYHVRSHAACSMQVHVHRTSPVRRTVVDTELVFLVNVGQWGDHQCLSTEDGGLYTATPRHAMSQIGRLEPLLDTAYQV